MKKLFLLPIVALFFGAFTTQKAQAQHCATRVISICPVCHQNVYAQYRPVNYGGLIRYTWVPAYHTACASHARSSCATSHHVTSYSRVSPYTRIVSPYSRVRTYNYATPNYGYRHYGHHSHRSHSCSTGYAGFVTPGFSIRISR